MICGLCGKPVKDVPYLLLKAEYAICPECKKQIFDAIRRVEADTTPFYQERRQEDKLSDTAALQRDLENKRG